MDKLENNLQLMYLSTKITTMKTNYYFLILAFLPISVFSQNTCATALTIGAGIHSITAVDGTDIPTPICAANGTGATAGEWYKYTPTADFSVTISTDLPGTGHYWLSAPSVTACGWFRDIGSASGQSCPG